MAGLTPKQDLGIQALLSQPTIAAAATMAGVSERTLYGWLKQVDFQDAYRTARREAVSHAMANLQYLSASAVAVLYTLMTNEKTPPSVKLGAAGKLLDLSIQSVDLEDVLARITALEERDAKPEH